MNTRTRLLKLLLSGLFLVLSISIMAQNAFITKWDTRNEGATANNKIAISLGEHADYTYDYSIDWGDGSNNEHVTDEITHTYATAGIYSVSITGNFPYMSMSTLFTKTDANKLLDIAQWGNIEWQSMKRSFADCENLIITATDAPDLSKVTILTGIFSRCASLNESIGHWNTSTIKEMNSCFSGATNFNQALNSWDVSNVETMASMFNTARAFNQPLNSWKVEKVEYMTSMFQYAESFNMPLGNWKTNSLKSTSKMFNGAEVFNQPIGEWDMSKNESMLQMFNGAYRFNQDISAWDVSNVTDMRNVFDLAKDFNQDISSWNVSKAKDMSRMFQYTESFNQDISGWNVQNVSNFRSMFYNSKAFDQNLGNWDIRAKFDSSPSLDNIFSNSNMSGVNYDATLMGWASKDAIHIPLNTTLGADGCVYSDADADRTKLINDFGWSINGDIKGVKIVFEDYDGTILKNEVIKSGEAATAPSEPIRENYTFTGWDNYFHNVTENIKVKAQYVLIGTETFSVNFVDWDGTILKTETVLENTNATPPTNPIRLGHTFTGWDKSFKIITSDLTITAVYKIETYLIYFVDYDFSALKMESIDYGKNATPPADPVRTGYIFTGWNESYNNIVSDLMLIAQYVTEETETFTVTFMDWDDTVLKTETVENGNSATAPVDPIREGYTFSSWNKEFNTITENTSITALYTLITAVPENTTRANIKIYPNPTMDILYVENSTYSFSKKQEITIFNNSGLQVYYSYKAINKLHRIDLSCFNTGLYFIKIDNEFFKIIKN